MTTKKNWKGILDDTSLGIMLITAIFTINLVLIKYIDELKGINPLRYWTILSLTLLFEMSILWMILSTTVSDDKKEETK